jgi:hypothetical protein
MTDFRRPTSLIGKVDQAALEAWKMERERRVLQLFAPKIKRKTSRVYGMTTASTTATPPHLPITPPPPLPPVVAPETTTKKIAPPAPIVVKQTALSKSPPPPPPPLPSRPPKLPIIKEEEKKRLQHSQSLVKVATDKIDTLSIVSLTSETLDAPNESVPTFCYHFHRWIDDTSDTSVAADDETASIELPSGASYLLSFDIAVESVDDAAVSAINMNNLHFTVDIPYAKSSVKDTFDDDSIIRLSSYRIGNIETPLEAKQRIESVGFVVVICKNYNVRTQALLPEVVYFPGSGSKERGGGKYRVQAKVCVLTNR